MMWDGLFTDYTARVVIAGSAMIGAVSGALGCFAYLRRQSLIGDVVSHASLLGIVLAFWIGYLVSGEGNKSLWILVPGAIAAGVGSLLLTKLITGRTRIKEDAGLGLMLAVFFGTGMMLLRWLQRSRPPIPGRAGLEDYLFGMAAAITQDDLWMIALLAVVSFAALILCWSRLKILTFDPVYMAGIGLPVRRLEALMLCLLVVGIVIGLQIVGVVLTVALLIAPASAARQWTRHLGPMVTLGAAIGSISAASGALVSATFDHLPTGPCIVVILNAVFVVSLLIAPRRGLLYRRKKRFVN